MRDLEFGIKANDRTAPAFESAEARAKRFNGELGKTNSAYGLAGTAAKAFAAAFTIGAIEGFGRLVKDVIGDAADLVDLADKVGVATGDVQRLQYGFKLAGIEASEVDGLLTQWSKRIGEAYTQGGKLANILKANGVSLTDSEGKLRSSVDLMRDYAELISMAGSDQERMVLALAGFGKSGDGIALALRDGAKGFDELMSKADEAGGVLDEEILRKAAEIDDAFDKMWRTFEINAKSAILNSASMLDSLITDFNSKWNQGERNKAASDLGAFFGSHATDSVTNTTANGSRFPVNDRFGTSPDEVQQNDALVRMMRDKFGSKTIIPDDTRTSLTKAATEQISAYQKVIDKLREEQSVLGMNATEQKIVNEQRQAGVTAVSAEGIAIAKLVTDIERQTAATKSLQEQTEFLKSSTSSFFTTWRHGMQDGEGVAASFFNAVGGFADTLASKMEERFASTLIDQLMGTVGGNGFSLLAPLFGGSSFPAAPKVGLSSVIGQPGAGSLIAPAAKMAGANVRIEQKIPASIQVAEEDDGAGGKRLAVMIDEENAASLARPGSRSSRAMRSRFGVKQRLVKR